jgi:hypothetical protein
MKTLKKILKIFLLKDRWLDNISLIGDFLLRNDTVDFILLQEIDRDSKRSYGIDQHP